MRFLVLVILLLWAATDPARAQGGPDAVETAASVDEARQLSEEIVVTGERSGPRVWRISKDGRELVVFGTVSPLPKGVKWNSKTVEALIGDADLVTSSAISIDFAGVGPFKLVGLLLEFRKQSQVPDGTKLKDVLDRDLYERFSAARARYGGSPTDWEDLRPIVVAGRLTEKAYDQAGIRSQNLQEDVRKIAKKKKRKWKTTSLTFKGNAKAALREAFSVADKNEIACLKETLDRLELDLPSQRSRANAWARGDVAALRALPQPQTRGSCESVLRGSKQLADLLDQGNAQWRATLDESLKNNASTFLVINIDTLLFGDFLKYYRDQGYLIEEP